MINNVCVQPVCSLHYLYGRWLLSCQIIPRTNTSILHSIMSSYILFSGCSKNHLKLVYNQNFDHFSSNTSIISFILLSNFKTFGLLYHFNYSNRTVQSTISFTKITYRTAKIFHEILTMILLLIVMINYIFSDKSRW